MTTKTASATGVWPLAIRLEVLPGDGMLEKFSNAAAYGFDAIELPGRYLNEYRDELLASKHRLPLKVSSISLGFRGSLVSADEKHRRTCRDDIVGLLDLCADLGAMGLVMPPLLRVDTLTQASDRDRWQSSEDLDAVLLAALPALADAAYRRNVSLLLEPVNRFETSYLTTLGHASRLCAQVNHPGLGITADFFHMQIEELKPAAALREAGHWIKHVHVAENTRVEPGPGSLDFHVGFDALREIGYQGYVVVECRGLSGPAQDVLPHSSDFLRRLMK